jgi:hypothetical protein
MRVETSLAVDEVEAVRSAELDAVPVVLVEPAPAAPVAPVLPVVDVVSLAMLLPVLPVLPLTPVPLAERDASVLAVPVVSLGEVVLEVLPAPAMEPLAPTEPDVVPEALLLLGEELAVSLAIDEDELCWPVLLAPDELVSGEVDAVAPVEPVEPVLPLVLGLVEAVLPEVPEALVLPAALKSDDEVPKVEEDGVLLAVDEGDVLALEELASGSLAPADPVEPVEPVLPVAP